jgi:hypothetical protein
MGGWGDGQPGPQVSLGSQFSIDDTLRMIFLLGPHSYGERHLIFTLKYSCGQSS